MNSNKTLKELKKIRDLELISDDFNTEVSIGDYLKKVLL